MFLNLGPEKERSKEKKGDKKDLVQEKGKGLLGCQKRMIGLEKSELKGLF